MNHIYRLVWNAYTHTWNAVSELTPVKGKKSGNARKLFMSLIALGIVPLLNAAPASVSINNQSGQTNAYVSGNGATVININNPNAAGISHNKFDRYNVDSQGLVLNNVSLHNQLEYQSQLAGAILGNKNLNQTASIILNEVVSPNRSLLRGFTEIAGSRADIVVANPYGITCSGCGFINTDRVTLSTGVPLFNANGSLAALNVNGGDILITGNGLNASAQQVMDLVTRKVKIEGNINAQDLAITTGAIKWDYASRSVTNTLSPNGMESTPDYAIDSSAVGGMYANKIKLTATEQGIGVRMKGDVAATAGDFTLNADGKIEINNNISAKNNVLIHSTDASINALVLDQAKIEALNIELGAITGKISAADSVLVASADLAVLGNLGVILNDTQLRAQNKTNIQAAQGNATLAGTTASAGNELTIQADNIALQNSNTHLGSDNNLNLKAKHTLDLDIATVAATNNITLTAGNLVKVEESSNNSGVGSTAGNITIQAANLINNGVIQSGKTLTVSGLNGEEITKIDLGNKSVLSSKQDMLINVATLNIAGDSANTAKIMAALGNSGTADIKVINDLTNNGLIFSGHDLILTAPNIINSNTAAISALNDSSLKANAGKLSLDTADNMPAGNIDNKGLIYAGHDLNATANGKLSNTTKEGVIQGGTGTMTLKAHEILNESEISAQGDITLIAAKFTNQVEGGDTREWVTSDKTDAKRIGSEYDDGGAGGYLDMFRNYKITWNEYQVYANGDPTQKHAAMISSNKNLNIIFSNGRNLGGTIYGKESINMQGFSVQNTGENYEEFGLYDDKANKFILSNASFINDNLSLTTISYEKYYTTHRKEDKLGGNPAPDYTGDVGYGSGWRLCSDKNDSACDYTSAPDDFSNTGDVSASNSHNNILKAGIYTASLTGTGFSLTNNGATSSISDAKEGNTAVHTGSTPQTPPPSGNIDIQLPTNPNGNFVTPKDPKADYLVEHNPLYGPGSAVGSDYLFSILGVDPEILYRRLGDASYEAYLIREQLIKETGNVILAGYDNADAQTTALMNNASDVSKNMGLQVGKALTPEQQAALTGDIVWMVETVVNGETVLAPVVYLSQATKNNIVSGSVIAANDMNLNLDSLTNTGGTIIGKDTLNITAEGDIANLSGNIKGGDISLTSTDGSIINQTLVEGSGEDKHYNTSIGNTAGIEATGDLNLDAKEDIKNIGATMHADGNAALKAGNDIVFDTVENKTTDTTHDGSTVTTTTTTEQVKSGLTAGGDLAMESGNDITLAGTDVKVGGDASFDAANDFNVVARENTTTTHSETHESGFGVNNALWGSNTTITDTESVRNVGSSIEVGGNAAMKAG